jgi:DNA end-binding protein Ku
MPQASVTTPDSMPMNVSALPDNPIAAAAPHGRPSWSGLLRLSLVAVPVKAYPAVASSATPSFNQLHAGCGQRIRYEKRCPCHGTVDAAAIVRGYQYAPDQYVTVETDELEKLRPARDKALVLEQLVPAHQVEPTFFAGRTLYLLPDGVAAQHPYAVVAAALAEAGQWALGRVVLSGHRQLVIVRARGRVLAVDVLHYPAQVRAAASWEAEIRDSGATVEELQLARQLLAAASGPLEWTRYRDTNAEELAALLEAKIAGHTPTVAEEPTTIKMGPLVEALKQSVLSVAGPTEAAQRAPRKAGARRKAAS